MKQIAIERIAKTSAVLVGILFAAHCKPSPTIGSAANTRANSGFTSSGEFVNPDAQLLVYDPPPPPNKDKEVFSHTQHGVDLPDKPREKDLKFKGRNIECADCHRGECKKGGTVDINRPGHDSCSGIGSCHPDFARNKTICKACHTGNVASFRPPLRPYGSGDVVSIKDYGFDYDHTTHLGPNASPSKRGKPEATCDTCHKMDKQGRNMSQAGHKECGQCHCDSDAEIKMNDCVKCHTGTELARSPHAYLDLRPHAQKFLHKDHMKDDKGQKAECVSCHVGIDESTTITEIAVPPMLSCLQSCHDGTHKNAAGKPIFDGWVQCAECHESGAASKARPAKKGKKK